MDSIKKKFLAWQKHETPEKKDELLCEIWEVYHPRLQVYVSGFSGNRGDVSDSVSEILLHVFESIHLYNGRNAFSTWLYTLARNRIIDQLRKKKVPNDSLGDFEPGDSCTPEDLLIKKTEQESVRDAVNRLSGGDREIIYLHFYEGLKYREISEITGIPLGTVKYRMSESRKTLKNDLERSRAL
jgi:RNA polymerase sigma-70 factor (ECF subfamily)